MRSARASCSAAIRPATSKLCRRPRRAMTPEQENLIDVERLVAELKARVARERAAGAYEDDLSGVELPAPPPAAEGTGAAPVLQGFDIEAPGPRVQFRPELGFSSKPVIGPVITLVKRFI